MTVGWFQTFISINEWTAGSTGDLRHLRSLSMSTGTMLQRIFTVGRESNRLPGCWIGEHRRRPAGDQCWERRLVQVISDTYRYFFPPVDNQTSTSIFWSVHLQYFGHFAQWWELAPHSITCCVEFRCSFQFVRVLRFSHHQKLLDQGLLYIMVNFNMAISYLYVVFSSYCQLQKLIFVTFGNKRRQIIFFLNAKNV